MAGIPLPQGDAFDSFAKGFHLPDNLMRQILARNQLSQQGEQFNKHHAQQEEHFKQQMDLRRAQMARAGMNSDLQRAIMQQQLVGLQHKNDPLYEMQQLQAMQNMFGGGNPQQAMQQEPQMPPPSQEMGEGMGMYSPEGMQEAQQVPQQPVAQQAPQGGINMDAIKNSPIMRGYFKKHFGVDLGAEDKAYSSLGKVLSDLKHAKATGAPEGYIKQLEQYAQRLAEGNQGVNLSVDPSTGAISFTSGGRGTQGNTQQIVDGQVISKPTTAVSTEQQKLQLAAIAREQALKHVEQPYLGAGASFQMAKDIGTYATSGDPVAKQQAADRLVKAAVSEKIVPEIANLQITSQGGKATVHALEKQEQAIRQGWPNFGKKLSDNLPKELQERVVEEHNARLKDISNIRKQYFAKGLPIDLKEEKSIEANNTEDFLKAIEPALLKMNPSYTIENIKHTAKEMGISEEEVIDQLNAKARQGAQ